MKNTEQTIEDTKALAERQESLVMRVTDAYKALQIAATTYRQSWEDWRKLSETMLPECRQWRMAVDMELTKTLQSFGEIRKFFLSDAHTVEVQRLQHFVELCERLKVLKDDGFLDRMTDTILRLELKDGPR